MKSSFMKIKKYGKIADSQFEKNHIHSMFKSNQIKFIEFFENYVCTNVALQYIIIIIH